MNNQPPADRTVNECARILEECRECPAADTLIAFHEDELAPGDDQTVAAHVGNCPDCARLLEQLTVAETPVMQDAAYHDARDEDRAEVAKALGFRVERPPATPLLERFSWLWEARVPALVPTAVCAMLLLVILWPAPKESPVIDLGPIFESYSMDLLTRSASEGPHTHQARVNATVLIHHSFVNSSVDEGTMVNREIIGPGGTAYLEPRSVILGEEDGRPALYVQFALSFREPGTYDLRLSHPQNAFAPVILRIVIDP